MKNYENAIDYNQELKDDFSVDFGGISYVGETLMEFMLEAGLPIGEASREEINSALVECGIMEI